MPRVLVLVIAMAIALAGCSGRAQPVASATTSAIATTTTGTTTGTGQSTPAASTPTVPPTPAPPPALPTLPPEAQEMTNDGAIAFVRHWFDLANYAQMSGDTEPMLAASEQECDVCREYARQIALSYSDGGYIVDNLWLLSDVSVTMRGDTVFGVQATFDQRNGLDVDASGSVRSVLPSDHRTFVAVIVYVDDGWKMTELTHP